MVHRLRPRAHGLFGQRRHQRVRQFAGDDRAEAAGRGAADGAQQRSARHQAQTDAAAACISKRAWRAARAGSRPRMLVAPSKGDYAFLEPEIAGVRSVRPRRRGPRSRRSGSMPSSTPSAASIAPARRVHITALLRDAQGAAALNVPLTLVVERPDGVEYRRAAVADQGLGGRSLSVPIDRRGLDRHLARARPSPIRSARRSARPPSWSRTMSPDRIEFELASPAEAALSAARRPSLSVDGRYPLRRAGFQARSSKARS